MKFKCPVIFVFIAATSCAGPSVHAVLPAPNPNGCYIIVYDHTDFQGARDLLNGPGRWPSLETTTHSNEEAWVNRIRSLRVGKTAILTVYADLELKGEALRLLSSTDHPFLAPKFSGRIKSLEISCSPTSAP